MRGSAIAFLRLGLMIPAAILAAMAVQAVTGVGLVRLLAAVADELWVLVLYRCITTPLVALTFVATALLVAPADHRRRFLHRIAG